MQPITRITLLVIISTLIACGDGSSDNNPPPGTCPATMTDLSALPGSNHRGTIDTDTVWAAADSPHILEANTVVNGATLSIEPCAVVLADADVSLSAGDNGKISAVGSADAPIRFDRHGTERWDYVLAQEMGSVSLAYVTLSGGGADLTTYDGATLVADGPTDRPYVENLDMQHVTITDSAGYGVLVGRHAAFAATSIDLVVTGAGADDAEHPSPIRIDAQAAGSVPSGTYTGNAADRIELDPFVAIEEDATIRAPGVAYWVSNFTNLRVVRAFGSTGAVPRLTIEAGVTLAFEPGTNAGFSVGDSSLNPGSLTINGTSDAPVTLTSAASSPAPGDWVGLVFAPGAGEQGSNHSLNHVIVEYAGGDTSIGGYACPSEDGSGNPLPEDGAVVIFGWAPTASFLSNSTLQHSLGWGVFRGWDTSEGGDVDFTATNTFLDLGACEQNDIKDSCSDTVIYNCAGTI